MRQVDDRASTKACEISICRSLIRLLRRTLAGLRLVLCATGISPACLLPFMVNLIYHRDTYRLDINYCTYLLLKLPT